MFSLPTRAYQRAYTLIELLITLCIAVILTSLAAPSFASLMRSTQSATVINSLASGFQLARTSAITYSQPVVFCARQTDTACGTDWNNGSLVFTDKNNNNQLDIEERALANIPATPTGSKIKISTFGNRKYLRFNAMGFLENYTAGNIVFCPPGGTARDARNLIFTRMGRLRFGTDINSDGIRENAEGQPLSCPS
jgi:type IV fimbrial biogenesis protein FimT